MADKREGGAVVRTTTNQTSKLTHQLPNTMRKRLPSPNYHLYLTPHQFEALAFHTTRKWSGLGGGGHERGKAREAKGRHTHLGACARLRVAPKEHPGRRRRRKKHHAGHEGQQQREQGGLVWLPTVPQIDFRAPGSNNLVLLLLLCTKLLLLCTPCKSGTRI